MSGDDYYIEHVVFDGGEDWLIYSREGKAFEDRMNGTEAMNGLYVFGLESAAEAECICVWLNHGGSLGTYYALDDSIPN